MGKKLTCMVYLVVVFGLAIAGTVSADIVGWWKLDETAGTIAADSSGYGNDGACQGDVAWVDGRIGGAWQGDGTGDYIRVPHSESLNLSDAVTVAMWLFGGQPPDQPICKGTDGSAWQSVFAIRLDDSPSRHIDFRGRTATAIGLNSVSAIPADEWVHIAATFDVAAEGNNQKIYINGALDAEKRVETPMVTNTADVLIGADGYSTTRWHWQGMLDDVRLYNEALPEGKIQTIMLGGDLGSELASNPDPETEAVDVRPDAVLSWTPGEYAAAHDVYFGTVLDDVNTADRANPMGVLLSQGQDANAYDPEGLLEFGQTYYWRVDEVNAAPDSTIFKGALWSFTAEPVAYPVENITATSNGVSQATAGPENTVNGSGLNDAGQHSTVADDMWLATPGDEPLWIQYEFEKVFKLHEMWVWNYNVMFETVLGFGVKDVTIEYSVDGVDWTVLGDVEIARATAAADYAHNTTVDLDGITAKFIRLVVNSGWGVLGQYGLSEVRFTYIPVQSREPQPADSATDVDPAVVLSWRAGREATSHDVYLGTDQESLSLVDSVSQTTVTPGALDFGTTYYWRVDEVGNDVWAGELWSFSTQEFALIDGFETYDDNIDAGTTIFDTWIDGWVNNNGSTVGYFDAPFAERTIVHSGRQSMPLQYDNTVSPFYSEASRTFDAAQDWTVHGADTLVVYFQGVPAPFAELASGKIVMGAAGADIWNAADEFRFAYKPLNGDGSTVARVESLANTNAWAKGGVMIRETLDPGSTFAAVYATPGNGCHYQARLTTDAAAVSDTAVTTPEQTALVAPHWVKIERVGNTFNGYYSTDGANWTAMSWNPQTIAMASNVYVGLAVTSHAAGVLTSAEFSGVETTGNVTGQWAVETVGPEQPEGNGTGQLYVTLEDAAGKTATANHPAGEAAVLLGGWNEWQIPLNEFAGVNLTRVDTMTIGVGNRANPTAGGAGIIYIDDIGYGKPATAE